MTSLAPLLVSAAVAVAPSGAPPQPRDEEGRFLNLDPRETHGLGGLIRWQILDRLDGSKRSSPDRAPVPTVAADRKRLREPPRRGEGARITWLGHSSFLVQMDGVSLLIDPVLGDRMGPGGMVGRNVPPPLRAEELPHIDLSLVSHDHWDHMDVPSLRAVGAPVLAGLDTDGPLAGEKLQHVGLRWWQSVRFRGLRITFVPAQHFSGRGVGNRDRTLWGGWVIEGSSATVYHAGDTASFAGFREIGRRFPSIDVAMLPIGAYDPRWFMEPVHVDPEQALQAFEELGARTFVAMHWGTFKQADEPLDEPPVRLEAERARRGISPERVRVLAVGESLDVRR
jgi:L-ascorbate metabolism protein UlaG (beta-lactamase superfamily)